MDDSDLPLSPSAAWLRQRFARHVHMQPLFEPDVPSQLIRAAVLIPLVEYDSGLTVLLTQRTAHLRDHAGQISFPGGRCEQCDGSAAATALREAQEEVGLQPSQIEILGTLPEYRTGSGFAITPVVALVPSPLHLTLDEFEVAEAFEAPLSFLLDSANHHRHRIARDGGWREYHAMPWQDHYIWGATAGMMISLRQFLFAAE
jgi:8-oxo-dGTP pyrophosphatase MutT (NUDIX family)